MYRRDSVGTILTIGYSDNLGSSGIQADIKTASAFGVAASSVITAVSYTNKDILPVMINLPEGEIINQLKSVFDSFRPDTIKIGFLPTSQSIRKVAEIISRFDNISVVVDPKIRPNDRMHERENQKKESILMDEMKRHLFSLADLVILNFEEAFSITGIGKLDNIKDFGKILYEKVGAKAILVKSGDSKTEYCTDILFSADDTRMFRQTKISAPDTTGAGDILATAICCGITKGFSLPKAVRMAKDYVTFAIQKGTDLKLGLGNGPLYIFKS